MIMRKQVSRVRVWVRSNSYAYFHLLLIILLCSHTHKNHWLKFLGIFAGRHMQWMFSPQKVVHFKMKNAHSLEEISVEVLYVGLCPWQGHSPNKRRFDPLLGALISGMLLSSVVNLHFIFYYCGWSSVLLCTFVLILLVQVFVFVLNLHHEFIFLFSLFAFYCFFFFFVISGPISMHLSSFVVLQ